MLLDNLFNVGDYDFGLWSQIDPSSPCAFE